MIAAYEAGEIDGVLVYNLDRLTRSPREFEGFIVWAEMNKVPLLNVEGDDLSNANGRMTARIKMATAAQEAERISERVSRAQLQRVREGKRPTGGRYRPYGYNRAMEVVPEEAELIVQWAKSIIAEVPLAALARDLAETGVPTATHASFWRISTIRNILTNEIYSGYQTFTYKDQVTGETITEVFKGAWDHIIDRGMWLALQDVLNDEGRVTSPGPARSYLLSGICICALCGSKMYGKRRTGKSARAKNGNKYYMYVCLKKLGGCGKVARSASHIEQMVFEWILRAKTHIITEEGIFDGHGRPVEAADQPEATEQEQDPIAPLEEKIETLRQRWTSGEIADEDYFPTLRDLRTKLNNAQVKAVAQARAEVGEQFEFIPAMHPTAEDNNEKSARAIARHTIQLWSDLDLARQRATILRDIEMVVVDKAAGQGGNGFDKATIKILPRKR